MLRELCYNSLSLTHPHSYLILIHLSSKSYTILSAMVIISDMVAVLPSVLEDKLISQPQPEYQQEIVDKHTVTLY
jgi:hypothetical protein